MIRQMGFPASAPPIPAPLAFSEGVSLDAAEPLRDDTRLRPGC